MQVQSLDPEDPFGGGNGNPLQYPCLENPMNRGAQRATVHGVTESDMTEGTHTFFFFFSFQITFAFFLVVAGIGSSMNCQK